MRYLLALLIFIPSLCFSQNTGLYGKKTILEVQGHGSWPIVSGWFNSNTFYKKQGSGLAEGRNIFDSGVRIGVMHAFSNQIGLGIEYGLEYQNMAAEDFIDLSFSTGSFEYTEFVEMRHEAINLNTFTIMPKFEFSSRSNLLPIGLSHQLGVGYTSTRMIEKDYIVNPILPSDSLITPLNTILDYTDRWSGVTVMYQINMRTPITDMIVISYGLRYNANFVRRFPIQPNQPGQLDMDLLVKEKRNETFFQLHVGAAFAF